MLDRSKLSPDGERTMVEIESKLIELCKMLTASVLRHSKPSRLEQRRARKAAKNLVMYKMYGRRPWVYCYEPRDWLYSGTCCANPGSTCPTKRQRMDHLREPSGFKAMSVLAEEATK